MASHWEAAGIAPPEDQVAPLFVETIVAVLFTAMPTQFPFPSVASETQTGVLDGAGPPAVHTGPAI